MSAPGPASLEERGNPGCLLVRRGEEHEAHDLAGPGGNKPGAPCAGLAVERCRHGEPEDACPSCAACSACTGDCGTCTYVQLPQAADTSATDDEEQALADDLCTSAHDRPADGSEGRACQECYDLACSVMDTPWLAKDRAQVAAKALREAAAELPPITKYRSDSTDWLMNRADRIEDGRG